MPPIFSMLSVIFVEPALEPFANASSLTGPYKDTVKAGNEFEHPPVTAALEEMATQMIASDRWVLARAQLCIGPTACAATMLPHSARALDEGAI